MEVASQMSSGVQAAGVQYILDTVIPSLLSSKDRTFIYGEIVSHFPA